MVATTEKEIIDLLIDPVRRREAFSQILEKYQRMLYYHIRRMVIDHDDANDVLQNTFIKAWKGLDNFRGDSALKTWLYRIATNESITFLNAKNKRSFSDVNDLQNDLKHSLSEGRYIQADELQLKLHEAILSLPERQRLVFNMRYYDEMKYEEISEVLGVTTGALKASYHHAVKKIEAIITGVAE